MPKLLKWLAALVVFSAVGASLLHVARSAKKAATPPEKVVIGTTLGEHSLLLFLAENQGFFRANHLEVTLAQYEAGAVAIQDLVAGKLDYATASDFVAAKTLFQRPDLRVLAILARVNDCVMVARKDRGIARPGDLVGKRIGVHHGTAGDFLLSRFLVLNGVAERDVKIVDVKISDSVQALAEGRVDADFSWLPYSDSALKRLGRNGTFLTSQQRLDYHWLLLGMEGNLKKKPEVAARLLGALREAETFYRKDPSRARGLLRSRFPLDGDAQNAYYHDLGLRQPLLLVMEEEARWLMKVGLIPDQPIPNYLNAIYFPALEAVKPAADTVVRAR